MKEEPNLIDPEEVFGVSRQYWERLEGGRILQTKALDNYIRTLNVMAMLQLLKKRQELRA